MWCKFVILALGINVASVTITQRNRQSAWNLPGLTALRFLGLSNGRKSGLWGPNLFYVGERVMIVNSTRLLEPLPRKFYNGRRWTLDVIFEPMAMAMRNEQLSVFAKATIVPNQHYMRWNNTKVQGFQVLAGAHINFDHIGLYKYFRNLNRVILRPQNPVVFYGPYVKVPSALFTPSLMEVGRQDKYFYV